MVSVVPAAGPNFLKRYGSRRFPMPRKKSTPPTPVAKRIRKARLAKKIPFNALANETGLSIDYLKKIEKGEEVPPVGTLLQISRALEIDSGTLLKADESKLKKRVRAYAKRTDNYAYTPLAPGAESKHLKAFKISIEPKNRTQGRRLSARRRGIYLCVERDR
jgi:transcriptional regulator with XRE-family HTH domain